MFRSVDSVVCRGEVIIRGRRNLSIATKELPHASLQNDGEFALKLPVPPSGLLGVVGVGGETPEEVPRFVRVVLADAVRQHRCFEPIAFPDRHERKVFPPESSLGLI